MRGMNLYNPGVNLDNVARTYVDSHRDTSRRPALTTRIIWFCRLLDLRRFGGHGGGGQVVQILLKQIKEVEVVGENTGVREGVYPKSSYGNTREVGLKRKGY